MNSMIGATVDFNTFATAINHQSHWQWLIQLRGLAE